MRIAVLATFLVLFWLDLSLTSDLARAQEGCGQTTIFVEQRGAVLFELPRQSGGRFNLEPGEPFTLRVGGAPGSGTVDVTLLLPLGRRITHEYSYFLPPGTPDQALVVRPEDLGQVARLARGIYPIEVTLKAFDQVPCSTAFETSLGVDEVKDVLGTPVGIAATGAAALAATGAIAAAGWSAAGAHTRLKASVAVDRRRKAGLRKWVPVPNWKRTVTGSVIGTISGILISVFMQQAGIEALTTYSIVRNAFVGAFGSVGVGLAWGSILTYLKPPVDPGEQQVPTTRAGPTPTVSGS